jgi:hypothetical protein
VLPRFEIVARRRPVDLVAPGPAAPLLAPYAAVTAALDGPATLELASGDVRLSVSYDGTGTGLEVTAAGRTTTHRSRRHGRPDGPVAELGLALTGTHLSVLTRADGPWTVRGRVDLTDRVDTRDEAWLAEVAAGSQGALTGLRSGGFGQLGLRDVRQVTHADGTTYRPDGPDGPVLLTATSAGPGFFDTAHTSVWSLDPATLELSHRSDLFFRRPDRPGAYGDHATHLLRDGDRWLVATSTWGDFDRRRPGATLSVTLAESTDDLLTGRHLLDTRALVLPTTGLKSVGVWDPHLVRTDDGWLVGFVSAPRFFRFHPALAAGPSLDALSLRSAATDRIATEGTTLMQLDGTWRVLASDGRDGRRGQRRGYPVFDLDLREVGSLDAPYPTNIPWPTLVPVGDSWLLVGFNGRPYGGPLPGYGTHGDVVFARPT